MKNYRAYTLLLILVVLQYSGPALAQELPVVEVHTNYGIITLELYPDKAPLTVANFMQYIDEGFYNDTLFHRVIKDFMIQGGGFDTEYQKKRTRAAIKNEANNGLKNTRGTIAMARRSDPDSATAQFFINLVDNAYLDFKSESYRGWGYCVFGRVIDGMEVVDEISTAPTGPAGPFRQNAPQGMIIINKIVRRQTTEEPLSED